MEGTVVVELGRNLGVNLENLKGEERFQCVVRVS